METSWKHAPVLLFAGLVAFGARFIGKACNRLRQVDTFVYIFEVI